MKLRTRELHGPSFEAHTYGMTIFKTVYATFIEALFPISPAEQEALSLDGATAYKALPRAAPAPMPLGCSLFSYKDERVRHLIWAIKYKKSLKAAEIAGKSLARVLFMYSQVATPLILVPMPITKRRRRERGFNQCELIVDSIQKAVAERFPTDSKSIIVSDLLIRKLHTSRQTLKDREERLESATDIFAVNETEAAHLHRFRNGPEKDPPYLILVIDDVITTGSTIKDAIITLRTAGFEKAFGMSVAH